jgi:hypothetical protein
MGILLGNSFPSENIKKLTCISRNAATSGRSLNFTLLLIIKIEIFLFFNWILIIRRPCGGGVQYLHRDPASRRRRRKREVSNLRQKIWSSVPRDSDPRKAALARASSIYKRHTASRKRGRPTENKPVTVKRVINIWSWAPDGARHQDLPTDWPSVTMWLWL